MIIPPRRLGGKLDLHQVRSIPTRGTNGSPGHASGGALPESSPLPWPRLCQSLNRGRLLVLAALVLLLLLGAVDGDRPTVLGLTLFVAALHAVGQEWALRRRYRPWLPIAGGIVDGLTVAVVVYSSGGPGSSLDVLFPVAILALSAQPAPLAALALAALDVWVYVPAVLSHPTYAPTQHLGLLVSRLLLFSLLAAGVYLVARANAGWRHEVELARRRWQKRGEEAERLRKTALGRANLIAMLSHDLRTPLTSVKGFAQLLLRDRSLAETAQRHASVILAETNRAIRAIADAVDLARLQCGREDLRLGQVDLRPIIEAAAAALHYHDPNGRIHVNLHESLPPVRADPSKVESIMVHLISSALRYSAGSGPIEVGASADGTGVAVWVQDGGGGISPDKFTHIFGLGTDDCEDESEFDGSGLGLYISKHLVEAHGGRMWIEAAEGRGSRFVFRLQS